MSAAEIVVGTILKSRRKREHLRIAVSEYKGSAYCDFRLTWTPDMPEATPRLTQKGVCFAASLIPEVIRALEAAQIEASKLAGKMAA